MELYQLRSFVAVAKSGHLTRAAEKLHLSQPAVSAHIKSLEEEFAVPLFERVPSGMVLTSAGRRLVGEAEAVIDGASALRTSARALNGEAAGHLSVGTLLDPEFIRVPSILKQSVERFPLLELELHHEISGAAFDKVRNGDLDASFYYGPQSHAAVATMALREVAFRIVFPASWDASVEQCGWGDLASHPWILAPRISTHHQLAHDLFESRGIVPSTFIEADSEVVIRSLVSAGLGIALMREDIAQADERAGLVRIWNALRLRAPLQFIWLDEREREPAMQALRAVVEDVWTAEPASPRVLAHVAE